MSAKCESAQKPGRYITITLFDPINPNISQTEKETTCVHIHCMLVHTISTLENASSGLNTFQNSLPRGAQVPPPRPLDALCPAIKLFCRDELKSLLSPDLPSVAKEVSTSYRWAPGNPALDSLSMF